MQAPLKEAYRTDPDRAVVVLRRKGTVDFDSLRCTLQTDRLQSGTDQVRVGLHPSAGGDGSGRCSGDMLLESLVGCAGVTLAAVATSMALPIRQCRIEAAAEMDFRGTLGVDRQVAVGIQKIDLVFHLDSEASPEQLDKLVQLTERYCVIFQTLKTGLVLGTRLA